METIFSITLVLHIACGFIALTMGLWALLVRPGGRIHRRVGTVFSWAMLGVVLSALLLASLRPNPFLFAVGVFSGVMVATGLRALRLKGLHSGQRPSALDWAILAIAIVSGLSLLGLGAFDYHRSADALALVSAAFGFVLLLQSIGDVRRFTRPPAYPQQWLRVHIGRMMGAFIATVTAFSAVNLTFLPTLVQWLWPTLVGALAIRLFRMRYAPGPKLAPTHSLDTGPQAQ